MLGLVVSLTAVAAASAAVNVKWVNSRVIVTGTSAAEQLSVSVLGSGQIRVAPLAGTTLTAGNACQLIATSVQCPAAGTLEVNAAGGTDVVTVEGGIRALLNGGAGDVYLPVARERHDSPGTTATTW